MSACKTVQIFHEASRVYGKPLLEINETDFDPKVHELYDEAKHGDGEDDSKKAPAAPKATKESLRAVLAAKNIDPPAKATLDDLQKMVDALVTPAGFN